MDLKWLDDFLTVYRLGSFSKAAKARNVTQPAFSRRIQSLEIWLGVPLFDRSVLPIALTHHGQEFLPHAQQIVRTASEAQQDFRASLAADSKLVQISSLHSLSIHRVPKLIAPFLAKNSTIRCEIFSSIQGVDAYFEALDNGMGHILIVYANSWHLRRGDLLVHRICRERLIPVVSRDFATRNGLPDLTSGSGRIPLISYPPFTFTHGILKTTHEQISGRLVHRAISSLGETQKALVAEGVGCAWLLEDSIRRELDDGSFVRCVPAGNDLECEVEIIAVRRDDLEHKPALKLWDDLVERHTDAKSA